jgi:hypothetical protein
MAFVDQPQVQQLEAGQLKSTSPTEEWRGLFLDNPAWARVGKEWPIGWVLENEAGDVVGSISSFPSIYQFRRQDLICANARGWVCAPDYRSYAPWLMEEFFSQPRVDLYISTTANANSEPICRTFATRVPVGDWESASYWITGYRGFARMALQKRGIPLAGALALPASAALWLKDTVLSGLPAFSSGVEISTIDTFDSRFEVFWEELVRQNPNKVLAARDRGTLTWHFAIAMRRTRLWIVTAVRNGLLRAYCILKRPGGENGLRRMRLIDYQTVETDTDLLPGILRVVLQHCAAEDLYVLEHVGRGLPKMQAIDQSASYRRKLPWAFYYHAANPALHAELRTPEVWDPSQFDGDASIG